MFVLWIFFLNRIWEKVEFIVVLNLFVSILGYFLFFMYILIEFEYIILFSWQFLGLQGFVDNREVCLVKSGRRDVNGLIDFFNIFFFQRQLLKFVFSS